VRIEGGKDPEKQKKKETREKTDPGLKEEKKN